MCPAVKNTMDMTIFDLTTENIATCITIDGLNAAAIKAVKTYNGDDVADFMDEFTNKHWLKIAERMRAMSDKKEIRSLFAEYLRWAFAYEIIVGQVIIITKEQTTINF